MNLDKKCTDRSIIIQSKPIDTIVTGATGLIGRWLVPELTRKNRHVLVLIRNAVSREDEYRNWVQNHGGDPALISFCEYEAEDPTKHISDLEVASVRDVYHLAARYEFGLSKTEARRMMVEGSRKFFGWCADLTSLRRFVLITGYLGHVHAKEILAASPSKRSKMVAQSYRQRGAYETAKVEENLVLTEEAKRLGIPLTVINPSAVIGDSMTGETTQFIGPSDMARDLFRGKLPALVGTKSTFVPLVTVDYVARFMAGVPDYPETAGQSYTLLDQKTPFLPDLIRKFGQHFDVPAPKTILPKKLVALLPSAVTGADKEVLTFLTEIPFDTQNAELQAKRMGISMPDLSSSMPRWLDFLVSKNFGETLHQQNGHMAHVAEGKTFISGNISDAELIYLHGLPFDGEIWSEVDRQTEIAACRPDLPGLGRNGLIVSNPNSWMHDLVKTSNRKPILVGHSLGCEYAVNYAANHPEQISGLVLISPFFLQPRASFWLRQPALVNLIVKLIGVKKLIFTAAARDGSSSAPIDSAISSLSRPQKVRNFARELSRASQHQVRKNLINALDQIRVPTLMIVGEHDPITAHDCPVLTHTISGAGHTPQLSNASAIATIIRNFHADVMTQTQTNHLKIAE